MVLSLKKFTNNITSPEQPNQKGNFLKRIGSLLEEGYSIKDALVFLEKIEKGHSHQWVLEVQKGMLLGHSFHEELEKLHFRSEEYTSELQSTGHIVYRLLLAHK